MKAIVNVLLKMKGVEQKDFIATEKMRKLKTYINKSNFIYSSKRMF